MPLGMVRSAVARLDVSGKAAVSATRLSGIFSSSPDRQQLGGGEYVAVEAVDFVVLCSGSSKYRSASRTNESPSTTTCVRALADSAVTPASRAGLL